MGGEVVGVERFDMYAGRPSRLQLRNLQVKAVATAGSQDHRCAWRQPLGQFGADLTATSENHDHTRTRVFHDCDYVLR